MQNVKLTVWTQVRQLIEAEKMTRCNTRRIIPTRILLPVALGLALLAPVAQAANFNPATTLTVYIHGFDADGPTSTWLAGDDSPNSDACGMWNDVQRLAPLLGAPTWQQNPTAPNCVCAATYYGSTLPAWYSDQDRSEDAAFASTEVVPKYALREAKYIRHCLNRAPGATSVHVMSASFGSLITRYLIEHNLLNLCSDGLISRWSPVVGVLRGNWLASSGDNLYVLALGQVFGVSHADDPDIPQMNYSWVDANISAHNTMNSPYFGPMVINQFTATDDDQGYITDVNNNANDNMNMNTDEFFEGSTTDAALHPDTGGTLMMPGLAYYRNYHTGIRDNSAMWASLAAAAQNNKRVTIRLSRLKAKGEDGWPYNNKQWVYHATVVSPRSAVLYGNTLPVSDLAWEDGVSPLFSIGQDETTTPNSAVFDMIVPPGETQLQLTFTLETLENQYTYYNVLRVGYGGNGQEGTFTLNISTTQDSTVTVSNDNLEADLSTSIHYVCYQPPALPRQTDQSVAELRLLTVTNTATDFNPPGDVLSYQLINAPSGAAIDTNGVITWTPTEAQGSTTNTIITAVSDGTSSVTNSFIATVTPPPTASVDTNALTTCGTTCISLSGSVGGCATGGVWTTTGTGTFSPDATTVNASYCPSAADYGQAITNTLTSQGPCETYSDATAQVVVTVIDPPTVSVGGNQVIYVGQSTVGLGGSIGGGATGGVWSASSTPLGGSFSPSDTALNATYDPSPTDIANGTVTLTLTTTGQPAPCPAATVQVVVAITARIITTTTLGGVGTPQTYGSTVLSASIAPSGVSGTVTFMDGTTNLASVTLTNGMTSLATNLTVAGSPHAIQAVYSGDYMYLNSSSPVSNVTVTAREVTLGGGKPYDKTATITPAQGLSLVNNVDGGNLYLTPPAGIADLAGWNAGPESITNASTIATAGTNITTTSTNIYMTSSNVTQNLNYNTPTRVQTQTGSGGTWVYGNTGSFSVGLVTPHDGSTLVALITTDGLNKPTITGVSQAGASWQRLATAQNNGTVMGAETELWYAPNVSGAGTTVTITLAKITGISQLAWIYQAAAVVTEYTNLTTSPLDAAYQANGSSGSFSTGSASTSQANELWVGGVGIEAFSAPTVSGLASGWSAYNSASHNANFLGYGVYTAVYALESVVTSQGSANCSGSLSPSSPWAGVLGTFKASSYYSYTTNISWVTNYTFATNYTYVTNYNFALAGPAAPNYMLTYSGTVTINPTNLTVKAATDTRLYDGTTNSAARPIIIAGGIQPGDSAPIGGWTEAYADKNAGTGKTLTPAGVVFDGNGGANYSYSYAQDYTGEIDPTNLTVTAASNTKEYDGTTSAAATPTLTAGIIQPGDTAPTWTETYDNANPGTGKTLIPAGVVSDGNGGANYNVNYAHDYTGVITPLEIAPGGQPSNQTVCAGSPASFTVYLPPTAGLTYQWQVSTNGGVSFTNVSDTETNASYTNLVTTTDDNSKQYQVIVGEGTTSLTSAPPAVLTVITPPAADAGTNQTSCGTNCISLDGSVGGGATGGQWRSSGTGAFVPDATTLNALYCPSAADMASGAVTLTLTSTGQLAPCGDATAQVVETLITPPTASAGSNQAICCGYLTAGLGGSIGGCATGGTWTSSGSGTFLPDATTLNATYTPSGADCSAGTVTLMLTSTGPCEPCGPAKAYVVVTLTQCGAIPVLTVITNNRNGSLTIKGTGTAGAQYYVVTSGSIKAPMSEWSPVVGSTNTAEGDGKWSCLVNDLTPGYYRATAVYPAP